ncbi:MAG: hypothetical protein ACI8XM_002772, partial [Haloarculaceae archaeon]
LSFDSSSTAASGVSVIGEGIVSLGVAASSPGS